MITNADPYIFGATNWFCIKFSPINSKYVWKSLEYSVCVNGFVFALYCSVVVYIDS